MEGGDDMAVWCVWLAVFVVCIGLEAASMALTSIWFAGGALIACVLSIAGVNLYIQLAVFVVVSFLLLYSTRPLALRYINQKTVRTNVDYNPFSSCVGNPAFVPEIHVSGHENHSDFIFSIYNLASLVNHIGGYFPLHFYYI